MFQENIFPLILTVIPKKLPTDRTSTTEETTWELTTGESSEIFRTKEFALNVIELYSLLPKRRVAQVLGDQVLRSGTSVGAHLRETQRAKSTPDFISKIEGGMQELEETAYWLELLQGAKLCTSKQLAHLEQEADELMAIFVTIVRKTKLGIRNEQQR